MKYEEFEKVIDLLKINHKFHLIENVVKIYWEQIGDRSFSEFEKIANEILANNEKLSLRLVLEKWEKFFSKDNEDQKIKRIIQKNGNCVLCKNTGRVLIEFMYLKKIKQVAVYKCTCELNFLWPAYAMYQERKFENPENNNMQENKAPKKIEGFKTLGESMNFDQFLK